MNLNKIINMAQAATKSKKAPASKSRGSANTKSTSKSGTSARSGSSGSQKGAEAPPQRSAADNSMLEKFLLDSLKDIYWAEKHLTKALPKLKKAATSQELKDAFDEHTAVTQEHVARLEEVFEMMGKRAQAKKCEAMEGLSKEAESIIEETEDGTATRDVGLIMAAQKVEHYEIATYGGLVQLTKILGLTDASDLLAQTLAEEKEADEMLTNIAENDINLQSAEEGEEEEEN
jgi:ferritin-like metal-binding protein YciE